MDFKLALDLDQKSACVELAKDVSSVANTDDESRFEDFGYLIVGAERGRIRGASSLGQDPDKLQSRITDLMKAYLWPVPTFSVALFMENDVPWGAIAIPPSNAQPHLITRDANCLVKHEWWVRVNDTNDRAGPQDFARVMAKSIRRHVQPLERELQRISSTLAGMSSATRVAAEIAPDSLSMGAALVKQIKVVTATAEAEIEEGLIQQALRLREVIDEDTEQNPQYLNPLSPEELARVVTYLEEQAMPLVTAVATIARYDARGTLTEALCRALRIIAKEPRPTANPSTSAMPQFRLYPFVLCVYAIFLVGANERRASLLSRIARLPLEIGSSGSQRSAISALDRVRNAEVRFKVLGETEPAIPRRALTVLGPRLAPLLAGTPLAMRSMWPNFSWRCSTYSYPTWCQPRDPLS